MIREIRINFAGGFPSFVNGPDDQTLSAPHISGGKYIAKLRPVFALDRLHIGRAIGIKLKLIDEHCLRAVEADRNDNKLRRIDPLRSRNRPIRLPPLLIDDPLNLNRVQAPSRALPRRPRSALS